MVATHLRDSQTSDGGPQLTSTAATCQQQGRRALEVLAFCRRGWRCHRSPTCSAAGECASEIAELAREVRGQWRRTGMCQR